MIYRNTFATSAVASLFLAGSAFAGTPGDNIADLVYNPLTGQVVIVPDPQIISFVLENASGGIDFLNTASIVFPSSSILVDRDPLIVGWTDLSGFAATVPFSLGNLLPANLPLSQVSLLLTTADFSRQLGQVGRFNIELVPEPTVLGIMAAGSVLALRRRKSN